MTHSLQLAEFPVGKTFGFDDVPDSVKALGFAPRQDPAIPSASPHYVHRREFVREVLSFLREPRGDALFVTGPTGSGKTSGITEILARLNWGCQQITAHGSMEMSDLIGSFRMVSKTPGAIPEMEFVHGVLPLAMKNGHVLLINELDYANPSEISGLNDVLEGRPLTIAENCETVWPENGFRCIFTGNSAGRGDDSGLYQGIQAQNIAFLDRCRISIVPYMDPDTEQNLLEAVVPIMPAKLTKMLVEVANAIRDQFLGESGTGADGTLSSTMSTRTLERWAYMAMDFRNHPAPLQYAMAQALTNRVPPEEKVAIEKIAAGILGDNWDPQSSR